MRKHSKNNIDSTPSLIFGKIIFSYKVNSLQPKGSKTNSLYYCLGSQVPSWKSLGYLPYWDRLYWDRLASLTLWF